MSRREQQRNEAFALVRVAAAITLAFAGLCVLQDHLRNPTPPLGDTVVRLLPWSEWGWGKRSDVPVPFPLPRSVEQGRVKNCRIVRIGATFQPSTPLNPINTFRPAGGAVFRDSIPMFYNFPASPRSSMRGRRRFLPPPPGFKRIKPATPSLATFFPQPIPAPPARRFRYPVRSGERISSAMAARLTRIGEGRRFGVIEVIHTQAIKVEPLL